MVCVCVFDYIYCICFPMRKIYMFKCKCNRLGWYKAFEHGFLWLDLLNII